MTESNILISLPSSTAELSVAVKGRSTLGSVSVAGFAIAVGVGPSIYDWLDAAVAPWRIRYHSQPLSTPDLLMGNLARSLSYLRSTPHAPANRAPEMKLRMHALPMLAESRAVLAPFEPISDASERLDDYIYGSR